jgi:hypothetical protein
VFTAATSKKLNCTVVHLGYGTLDGRILLRYIRKIAVKMRSGFRRLRIGIVVYLL